ncbi:MAG: hypothetical protein EA360_00690 [Balneolaceae bacterium]|nr:MAG: hypothetical protein EA360_00690 [Balneolaceae bacterium]
MKIKTFLIVCVLILEVAPVQSQTLPALQPPFTLEIENPEDIQALEQAAFAFAVRLSALIYLYQGLIEDESFRRQLTSHDQYLTILLRRGNLTGSLDQMAIIQQNVRNIITEAIELERQLLLDLEERELFDREIQLLREYAEPIDLIREHSGYLQNESEFERFETSDFGTRLQTGESETASEIHFQTDFIPDNDFYLQVQFQLVSYRPLVWNPSAGLIFGSDGGENYYLLKLNVIEQGIDFQAVNFGSSDDLNLFFPVENLNLQRAGNELGVYRRGDMYYLFLNKELIFDARTLPLYGNYVGIYADPGMEISVARFHLYQHRRAEIPAEK